MSHKKNVAAVILLAVAMMCIAAEPAFAASKIGDNIGDEVKSWGSALLLGTAALVGLPALAKRDFGGILVVVGSAMVLGGLIFATGTVKTIIDGIWTAIGAGA